VNLAAIVDISAAGKDINYEELGFTVASNGSTNLYLKVCTGVQTQCGSDPSSLVEFRQR